jgi:hypothetical protein
MLQKLPEMLSLRIKNIKVFWERTLSPSYIFLINHLRAGGNGTEGKIGAGEAPQKRLEWENLIYIPCCLKYKFKVIIKVIEYS